MCEKCDPPKQCHSIICRYAGRCVFNVLSHIASPHIIPPISYPPFYYSFHPASTVHQSITSGFATKSLPPPRPPIVLDRSSTLPLRFRSSLLFATSRADGGAFI